jgi:predicted dehydrogenase
VRCSHIYKRAFDNYEEAITDKEIEAVVLATKPRDHAKQVALAAKHGKAIFCEKPLGLVGLEWAFMLCFDCFVTG